MSLDVYLRPDTDALLVAADYLQEGGFEYAANFLRDKASNASNLFERNITHNLGKMASEAGLYECCCRPEDIDVKCAKDLIPLLEKGLDKLEANPAHYKQFEPSNGWGSYGNLVHFVRLYLEACYEFPEAQVVVDR